MPGFVRGDETFKDAERQAAWNRMLLAAKGPCGDALEPYLSAVCR